MTAKVWQKPFALWVIAGGLVYMSIALLYLGLQFALAGGLTGTGGGLLAFLFIFIAIFLIAAGFSLREKRWAYVLSAAASIVLLLLFGSSSSIATETPRTPDSGFPRPAFPCFRSSSSFRSSRSGKGRRAWRRTATSPAHSRSAAC